MLDSCSGGPGFLELGASVNLEIAEVRTINTLRDIETPTLLMRHSVELVYQMENCYATSLDCYYYFVN
jgi:hypothetical protein